MSPLTEAEQRYLLALARQAVDCAARAQPPSPLQEPVGNLAERCGAFVTLRKGSDLRGCIGHIESFKSLSETVRDCAAAAALSDPRFEPVTPPEVTDLHVEISVLSPLQDLAPDQIEVGRHGLVISLGERRGVLLPQVPCDMDWNLIRFLEETCRKAGLRTDAWQHGARIQAFTTQMFGETTGSASDHR